MNTIFFEGIRCFRERQEVRLRPITLLVGENNSGKTTFLALTRIIWDLSIGNMRGLGLRDPFNEAPFLLGAFSQIVPSGFSRRHSESPPIVGSTFCTAHGEWRQLPKGGTIEVTVSLIERSGQPEIGSWTISGGAQSINVNLVGDDSNHRAVVTITDQELPQPARINIHTSEWEFTSLDVDVMLHMYQVNPEFESNPNSISSVVRDSLRQLLRMPASRSPRRPVAFAPIRERPERTYDPVSAARTPEGSHVPMILAQLSGQRSEEWTVLRSVLIGFGKASGLFTDLKVRHKGNAEGDPFQIEVKALGSAVNLVDAGYGISQVLPLVVDTVRAPSGSRFLIQQPEVHLHPRAQAELGSFFGHLAKTQDKSFVVETHSDYLIDRIRMDVRDRKGLRPEDVVILFFEKTKFGVRIHEILVDDEGNVVGPPPSYREFFLTEGRRLLGF